MKRTLFLLMLCAGWAWAAEPSLEVSASPTSLYLGESFVLRVTAENLPEEETPNLSALAARAQVEMQGGPRVSSFSNMSIVNGRMTREERRTVVYQYLVTPRATGVLPLGPITCGTARAPEVRVHVLEVADQSDVLISFEPSAREVLVEEPFEVTLKLSVRALPSPLGDEIEPLHPGYPPRLKSSFFDIVDSDAALTRPAMGDLLNARAARRPNAPAFNINDYTMRSSSGLGFSSLFGEDPFAAPVPARFAFPCTREELGGTNYCTYTFTARYQPHETGTLRFGPATFRGSIMTKLEAGQAPEMNAVYAVAPAVEVRVVPPPVEGRPNSFIGCVGKRPEVSAQLSAVVCKVGEPLELSLTVTGGVSVANMHAPALEGLPGLEGNFRVYEESVKTDTLPDGKRFAWRVRPLRAGTTEFPAIPISWFDSDTRRYETQMTSPIPLQAQAAAQIALEGEASAAEEAEPESGALEVFKHLSAVSLSPEGVETRALFGTRLVEVDWLIMFALGPLVALLAFLVRPLGRGAKKIAASLRMGGARGVALRALASAQSPEAALAAVRVYAARRLRISCGAATAEDLAGRFAAAGVSAEVCAELRRALAAVEERLYRGGAAQAGDFSAVAAAVAAVDAALRRSGFARAGVLLALTMLLVSVAGASQLRAFLWEQAATQALHAETSEDFAALQQTYQRLVDDGARNAPLFVNLGSAALAAGDGETAAAAFARAERYAGWSPETREGVMVAQALRRGRRRADASWERVVFFWHHAASCETMLFVALGGWTLFWLGVAAGPRRRRGWLRGLCQFCMCVGLLVAVIAGGSVAVSVWGEHQDEAQREVTAK